MIRKSCFLPWQNKTYSIAGENGSFGNSKLLLLYTSMFTETYCSISLQTVLKSILLDLGLSEKTGLTLEIWSAFT